MATELIKQNFPISVMTVKSPAQKHPSITVLHGLLVFLINSGGQIPSTLPFGLNRFQEELPLNVLLLHSRLCDMRVVNRKNMKMDLKKSPFWLTPLPPNLLMQRVN